ncbi:MAG TPA: hypothetical protein VFM63_02715 [Pyrinomonadaceae bacterium]|nr:hypothetical protein [Pyrinomonadaceae bacterium]
MKRWQKHVFVTVTFLALAGSIASPINFAAVVQDKPVVVTGADLTRLVPASYYFKGQSAPTQMRNTAAVKLGAERFVIVGLVDTSGYSAEVRAKYEGFFITDSPIKVNGESLPTGAYGFGFSNDGKMRVMDIAGNDVLTVSSTNDKDLRRPRPLMMTASEQGIRFYSRRDYVVITAN